MRLQQLDAPFWGEDLNDSGAEHDDDPNLDILPLDTLPAGESDYIGITKLAGEDEDTESASPKNAEPVCALHLDLNKGSERDILFYHMIHDKPVELFWLLMSLFEQDGDFWNDY